MSGVEKSLQKERAMRLKSQRQRVFISGIEGHHTLEIGVAYHFRGHYIYAWPAGNPIEPIPFSTKKGISIRGIVVESAPQYHPQAEGLELEENLAALKKSCAHELEDQKEREEEMKKQTTQAIEQEHEENGKLEVDETSQASSRMVVASDAHMPASTRPPSRVVSFPTLPLHQHSASHGGGGSHNSLTSLAASHRRNSASMSNIPQIRTVTAPSLPSVTAFAPQTFSSNYNNQTYTPHDRANFLAASAPGSRHVSGTTTPYEPRPLSPSHGPEPPGSHSFGSCGALKPIASTLQLLRLLAEEGIGRSFSTPHLEDTLGRMGPSTLAYDEDEEEEFEPDTNLSTDWIDPSDINAFVRTVSRAPSRSSRPVSRSASRDLSRAHSPVAQDNMNEHMYLPGLGYKEGPHSLGKTRNPTPPVVEDANKHLPLPGLGNVDDPRSLSRMTSRTPTPTPPTFLGGRSVTTLAEQSRIRSGVSGTSAFPALYSPMPSYHDASTQYYMPVSALHSSGSANNPTRPRLTSIGRPRKASLLLNSAYNAANPPRPVFDLSLNDEPSVQDPFHVGDPSVHDPSGQDLSVQDPAIEDPYVPKCALHGDDCDGVTVTEKHITQRARESSGFKDLYPQIKSEDKERRVMVDWQMLYEEVKEETEREAEEREREKEREKEKEKEGQEKRMV